MTAVDWHLKALELVTCNCDVGCPCQFDSLPTSGDCRAAAGYRIDEGRFGNTTLDGVKFVRIWAWPGPIHEGRGEGLLIVDEQASSAQHDAVHALFHGEETEPGATIFNVFATVIDTFHEPLRAPIDFDANVEERTGHFSVPGVIHARGGPIKNPVSGDPHRARVTLPHGFEYHEAEYGRSTVGSGKSSIALDHVDAHAHFAYLDWTRNGPVHGWHVALSAVLLLLAGLYQLTPVKQACLRHCRSPIAFISEHWRHGRCGALAMGTRHGAYCAGCCWCLMGLLFLGGVMNRWWIAGLALFVALEKLGPAGDAVRRVTGPGLSAFGVWLLSPAW